MNLKREKEPAIERRKQVFCSPVGYSRWKDPEAGGGVLCSAGKKPVCLRLETERGARWVSSGGVCRLW